MRLVNLVIIFASLSISASILFWYRNQLREEQEKKRVQALIEKISENKHEINQAIYQYEEILQSERYISKAKFPKWLEQWKYLKPILLEYRDSNLVQENDSEIRHLLEILLTGDSKIKHKNEKYIQQELTSNKVFFDNIEDHPLTENQRKTIVIDETNNLVVAGAGSGKTSTIIGKAGYLLENNYVDPSELLLISFARKARDEMFERGQEKINKELNVHTFHSLGLNIIGQVEGCLLYTSPSPRDRS